MCALAKVIPLYSGSSGNCVFVGSGQRGILVDIGKSYRRTAAALCEAGLSIDSVGAVLITHEHTDHIAGLRVFLKHRNIPVYASAPTADYIESHGLLPPGSAVIRTAPKFAVEDYEVEPFHTSHDAADCQGYKITFPGGQTAAVATDLGYISDTVLAALSGCSAVVLESNYDPHMLRAGPYPYVLKRRISGECGHLSNEDCAAVLPELIRRGTAHIVLAHLSQINNQPDLAYITAEGALRGCAMVAGEDFTLSVAKREMVSEAVLF